MDAPPPAFPGTLNATEGRYRNASLPRRLALASAALPVAILLAVALQPWVPAHELLRDPMATVGERSDCCGLHLGLVSYLGVGLWASTAAICLFAALCLRDEPAERASTVRFLVGAGLLSVWLTLDDLLMLHERVLPDLGVPELATYAVYGVAGLAHLRVALRVASPGIAAPGTRALLFVAIASLGASVVSDTILEAAGWAVPIGLEDGAKLVGITFWLAFHTALAHARLAARTSA